MVIRILIRSFLLLLLLHFSGVPAAGQSRSKAVDKAAAALKKWENPVKEYNHIGKPKVDSVKQGKDPLSLDVFLSRSLSYFPLREKDCSELKNSILKQLGRKFRNYTIKIYSNGFAIEDLVPNIYKTEMKPDSGRRVPPSAPSKFIERADFQYPASGLSGKNIALWHSHGYYYEQTLDRWEWQRARLFGTVEDLSVMGFVLPYLTKMLENAGAYTLIPRERDTNKNEVITDNDRSTGKSQVVIHLQGGSASLSTGFLLTDTLFTGDNPFRKGTSLRIKGGSAVYIPEIPETGEYSVYVSWPAGKDNSSRVLYEVTHAGGVSRFYADQRWGGGTWIWLGSFRFSKGLDASEGSVRVLNSSAEGYVGLDAIKFGGGMGSVARKPALQAVATKRSVDESVVPDKVLQPDNTSYSWKTSGKPRFTEGARYFLQYAGAPDTLVYSPNLGRNDYNDDYQCRGLWVNYLKAPVFPAKGEKPGLGIPVDLSFAFHTDAGITPDDSVIGTLAIYSTGQGDKRFTNGYSRLISRDLSDIIQSELVNDLRLKYDSEWTRRGLWDRPYSEALRPDVPSVLLELLSHQNMADMKFGLDPAFRFDVSRAIYKGILKYFAFYEGRPYVVQPLAVNSFSVSRAGNNKVLLRWKPVVDSLEPTSKPDRYRVSVRKGNAGFDNGFITRNDSAIIAVSKDTVYSFRITAINDGGESFGSEILSAAISSAEQGTVIVVNGFDRVSGPSWFDTGSMAGIEWWKDRGVPDKSDIVTTGDQYDFDRKSEWLDDDSPGWGASNSDREGTVIAGNSFDYPYIHGLSILKSGYSFFSCSDESFLSDRTIPADRHVVDFIFGEEKKTVSPAGKTQFDIYTNDFMERFAALSDAGVPFLVSGAYIGSDINVSPSDSSELKFATQVLHISPRTGNAVNSGEIYSTDAVKSAFSGTWNFNTGFTAGIYPAEYPDALEAYGKGAVTAFRYTQNNTSAAVLYRGYYKSLVMGFPFETVVTQNERDNLMKQILTYLNTK